MLHYILAQVSIQYFKKPSHPHLEVFKRIYILLFEFLVLNIWCYPIQKFSQHLEAGFDSQSLAQMTFRHPYPTLSRLSQVG